MRAAKGLFLLTGAIVLLFGFLHVAALLSGPSWLRALHAPPDIVQSAQKGTLLAPLSIAMIFGLSTAAAAYLLSAADVCVRLPLLRWVLSGLVAVCLLRAGLWVLMYVQAPLARPYLLDQFELISAVGFLVVGMAIAVGLKDRWSALGKLRL